MLFQQRVGNLHFLDFRQKSFITSTTGQFYSPCFRVFVKLDDFLPRKANRCKGQGEGGQDAGQQHVAGEI